MDEVTQATPPVTSSEVTQAEGDTSEEADPVAAEVANVETKAESSEATTEATTEADPVASEVANVETKAESSEATTQATTEQPAEPASPLSAAAPPPPKGESVPRSLSVSGKSLPVPKKYTKK